MNTLSRIFDVARPRMDRAARRLARSMSGASESALEKYSRALGRVRAITYVSIVVDILVAVFFAGEQLARQSYLYSPAALWATPGMRIVCGLGLLSAALCFGVTYWERQIYWMAPVAERTRQGLLAIDYATHNSDAGAWYAKVRANDRALRRFDVEVMRCLSETEYQVDPKPSITGGSIEKRVAAH
jgi:hypothetical protein